jgi:sugar O-acyltransferase (sialic acid O-acetyltransferase NeuD family)
MLIIGTGGLALQMIDEFEMAFEKQLVFWNNSDNERNVITQKYNVLKTDEEVAFYFKEFGPQYIVAVGDVFNREKLLLHFDGLGGQISTFIARSASISKYCTIEDGALIAANVTIEAGVKIGKCSLINTNATVTHECSIGNFNEVAPMATFGGNVTTGNFVFVGLNATILPKIKIGNNCIIGAGAVVTKSVQDNTRIKGVPAK